MADTGMDRGIIQTDLMERPLGGVEINPQITQPDVKEKTPSWLKNTIKKVTDAWFDPKSFEQNPELYEKLGIRFFKKWMPTTGDVVHQLVLKKIGLGDFVEPNNLQSLKNYETFTRVYESIHIAFLTLGVGTMATQLATGHLAEASFTAGINTLVNVYPIMLQRYNRTRLYKAISKMESRTKSDLPTSEIENN